MKLKCLGSSSAGNCYLLTSDSEETLILDCGIPIKEIKKGLNWNIRGIKGMIISHAHL
ncbi:MBL fold metallo-hydrolase [Agathobacter sp.]|mgnify:FL=1|jgi:Cft2 family RNA processing exonuclease|uniref:MBL fold metallo-hydrolase n=1 Tax=Agathobacter sp. TaxID=2021311 RepID=UPI00206A80FF|nr:MAG TPA: YycJ-like MBL-fold protein [Bacteriophage sp.]